MKTLNVNDWMREHGTFATWWNNHPHAGFYRDERGYSHWNTEPWVAYQCDRYRQEFAHETGSHYHSRFEQ